VTKKPKGKVEFRYYEIPQNEPLIALMGSKWVQLYGTDVDDLHFHNLLEIGHCYLGTGDIVFENSTQPFDAGMITSIPKNYLHTTMSDKDIISGWEYLFIDADAYLSEMYQDNQIFAQKLIKAINKKAFVIFEEDHRELSELVNIIFREMRERKVYYLESIRGLMLPMFLEIARINECSAEKIAPVIPESIKIVPALDHVSRRYFGELKVKELAEVCFMSETHFRRTFETCMNMTPLDYINLVRIQAACDLMNKGSDSMKDISKKVGFISQTTFNRNFKKIVGVTPYKWKSHPENYEGKLINYRISAFKGW